MITHVSKRNIPSTVIAIACICIVMQSRDALALTWDDIECAIVRTIGGAAYWTEQHWHTVKRPAKGWLERVHYGSVEEFLADDENQVSLGGYDAVLVSPYDISEDDGPI